MSLVEKALEKLRVTRLAEQADGHSGPRAAPEPVVAPRPAATSAGAVSAIGLARSVSINERALTEAGILAPPDEVHRVASEYRQIKRAVLEAVAAPHGPGSRDPRIIAVTSALPGDGKTHTSVNLALSLSRERDVAAVLVDADVAKADVTGVLGLSAEPGVLDFLSGEESDVAALVRPTDHANLWVLPAGGHGKSATDSAAELVSAERVAALVKALLAAMPRAIVILDSPPLLLTPEAQVIAGAAGQILVVVKAAETPQQAVSDAVAKLGDHSRVRLVLNMSDVLVNASYYYGNYYNR